MAEQRPIVYFQRLMGNYDRQVAEIMKAKREYIVFADEDANDLPLIDKKQPVEVEVLMPTKAPASTHTKPIVELNAPLEERELVATQTVEEAMQQTSTQTAPSETPSINDDAQVKSEEVKEVEEPAKEVTKAKPMTGLGLNLDSIFNEEFSAEKTGYFGK